MCAWREDGDLPTARSEELLVQLDDIIGDDATDVAGEVIDFQPTGLSLDLGLGGLGLPDLAPADAPAPVAASTST